MSLDFLIWFNFYPSPGDRCREGNCDVWPGRPRRWRRTGRARVHQVSSFQPFPSLSFFVHFLPFLSLFIFPHLSFPQFLFIPLPSPYHHPPHPHPSQGLSQRSRLCSNPERSGSRSRGVGRWVGRPWQQKKKKKCVENRKDHLVRESMINVYGQNMPLPSKLIPA